MGGASQAMNANGSGDGCEDAPIVTHLLKSCWVTAGGIVTSLLTWLVM